MIEHHVGGVSSHSLGASGHSVGRVGLHASECGIGRVLSLIDASDHNLTTRGKALDRWRSGGHGLNAGHVADIR